MKYIFAFLLLFAYSIGYNQIIINGKINNYDGKSKVHYTPTVDGIIPVLARTGKSIIPRRDGRFKIRYENDGFGTVKLHFSGLTFAFFYHENTEINLVIDQDKIKFPKERRGEYTADSVKQAATISITGDFAELNRYYNRMIRSSTMTLSVSGCYFSRLVKEIETPAKVISFIDSLTQIELTQIRALGTEINSEKSTPDAVTPEVKKFLENQVRAFYGSVFLSGMMLKRFEQNRKLTADPNAPRTIYNAEWERLVENFSSLLTARVPHVTYDERSSGLTGLIPSANSFEYNEFILNMAYTQDHYRKYYRKYDFEPSATTHDKLVVERLVRPTLSLLDSLSLLDDKTILAYKLHNLARFLYTQTFYSPVLLNAVNKVKDQYPNSPHIALYGPQVERLKTYLETTSLQYEKARIVETNYVHFSDLLETFKGKNLLIDVWATWCGPCVDDFNYKSILKPYIDEGKITVLYISIDKPGWKKRWKENIKYNQLEGYHVLADDVLIRDMWDYLGGTQGMIPRYALIDKNGSIYLNNAARPSEGDQLVTQIKSLLERE